MVRAMLLDDETNKAEAAVTVMNNWLSRITTVVKMAGLVEEAEDACSCGTVRETVQIWKRANRFTTDVSNAKICTIVQAYNSETIINETSINQNMPAAYNSGTVARTILV